jgi:hypothetical protein
MNTNSNMVCAGAESVLILEYYFASKSFTAIREVFSNAYPDNEVQSKTMHHLATTFRTQEVFFCDKYRQSR